MGKSCVKHNFFSLGGQYNSLGHPKPHNLSKTIFSYIVEKWFTKIQ